MSGHSERVRQPGGAVRVVRAAGGVVCRDGAGGPEVVLVHRPRYDDWSLPKGKLGDGEYPLAAAVREVEEETGVRAVPRLRLPPIRYLTGVPGAEKSVEYWAMHGAAPGGFTPNDEVDRVRWVPVAQAGGLLTYSHDRGVLAGYAELPPVTGLVVLLRHAYAGRCIDSPRLDVQRPLDAKGRATAVALAGLLALFEPGQIVSGTPVRCVQSVEPLAAALSLPIRTDERFDETAEPAETADAVRALAASGITAVVCSQGKVIPEVVRLLANRAADRLTDKTPKGASWVLPFSAKDLISAAYLEPPG